jgi:Na+/melibiose symporter-like transporter
MFGVNYGTSSILLRAMMSDVIDVDRLETGQDRSGLYFALLTLTAKIGLAAPLIIAYPVLSAIGFNAAGTNAPEAISVLAGIYIFVPLAVNVIGIVVMRRFPIDAAQQALMRAEITKRTAARLGRI